MSRSGIMDGMRRPGALVFVRYILNLLLPLTPLSATKLRPSNEADEAKDWEENYDTMVIGDTYLYSIVYFLPKK